VAQGAAIQSAIKSGVIPRHVIRNATMLDVLPHPIGVLLSGRGDGRGDGGGEKEEEEMYVPILERGTTLPAMNYATFELAKLNQGGVTIVAVEDVGEDFRLERLGEFNFLLHRLSEADANADATIVTSGKRMIRVGMTVQMDGKFIVSVFDENDPEDVKKKEAYQEWKKMKQKEMEEEGGDDGDGDVPVYVLGRDSDKGSNGVGSSNTTGGSGSGISSREELLLTVGCLLLLAVYMSVKFLFHEVEVGSSKII